MKIVFWVTAGLLAVGMFQYGLFKENGAPRQIPTLQQVLR